MKISREDLDITQIFRLLEIEGTMLVDTLLGFLPNAQAQAMATLFNETTHPLDPALLITPTDHDVSITWRAYEGINDASYLREPLN